MFSDSDSSSDEEADPRTVALSAHLSVLDGIESKLGIYGPPPRATAAPAEDTAGANTDGNSTHFPADTTDAELQRHAQTIIADVDRRDILQLIKREKRAKRRRDSVQLSANSIRNDVHARRKAQALEDACMVYATERMASSATPRLLLNNLTGAAGGLGGRPIALVRAVRDPVKSLRGRAAVATATAMPAGSTVAFDRLVKKAAGCSEGLAAIGQWLTLTDCGCVCMWRPCSAVDPSKNRLADPFRKRDPDGGGHRRSTVREPQFKGLALQGFVEIDPSGGLEWPSSSEGEGDDEEGNDADRDEGKDADGDDDEDRSGTDGTGSEASWDGSGRREAVRRPLVAAGCFLGPGRTLWRRERETQDADDTAPAHDTGEAQHFEVSCVSHLLFVVAACDQHMSLHEVRSRCRARLAAGTTEGAHKEFNAEKKGGDHEGKEQGGGGKDGGESSGGEDTVHRRWEFPASGLDFQDEQFLTVRTLSNRKNPVVAMDGRPVAAVTPLLSRGLVLVCGGSIVAGLSVTRGKIPGERPVPLLTTSFSIDLAGSPSLGVDQATACSMLAWRGTCFHAGAKTAPPKTRATRSGEPMTVNFLLADDAAGMVVAGTDSGLLVKVGLKMKRASASLAATEGGRAEASGALVSTPPPITPQVPPKAAWATLMADGLASSTLSFMHNSNDRAKPAAAATAHTICWNGAVSNVGMGFAGKHDCTLTLTDGTACRVLVLSELLKVGGNNKRVVIEAPSPPASPSASADANPSVAAKDTTATAASSTAMSAAASGSANPSRRQQPLTGDLWLPEHFAARGCVRVDRLLVGLQGTGGSQRWRWLACAASPDAALVCLAGVRREIAEGKRQDPDVDDEEGSRLLVLCWDAIHDRAVSTIKLDRTFPAAAASPSAGQFSLEYCLLQPGHLTRISEGSSASASTAGRATSRPEETRVSMSSADLFKLQAAGIGPSPLPFARSAARKRDQDRILSHLTDHVIVLESDEGFAVLDVTDAFEQVTAMLTAKSYLLERVSEKVLRQMAAARSMERKPQQQAAAAAAAAGDDDDRGAAADAREGQGDAHGDEFAAAKRGAKKRILGRMTALQTMGGGRLGTFAAVQQAKTDDSAGKKGGKTGDGDDESGSAAKTSSSRKKKTKKKRKTRAKRGKK